MPVGEHSYPINSFTNTKEWHVYYVFNDPDFRKSALKLATKYKFIRDGDNYIEQGLNMLSQLLEAQKDPEWTRLRDGFCIDDSELVYFMRGAADQGFVDARLDDYMGYAQIDYGFLITLKMAPHITYDGYLRLWEDVKKLKNQLNMPTKRKTLENPDLIYAIFKAHKILNFSVIFAMYKDGKLPGYSGSTKQFTTKDELKKYYKLYRPDR